MWGCKNSIKAHAAIQIQNCITSLYLDPNTFNLETYKNIIINKLFPVCLQILKIIAMQSEENFLTSNSFVYWEVHLFYYKCWQASNSKDV